MSTKISLKEAEKKAFRTVHQDGLWDIFIGCVFIMFALAPFLSADLGDFWSSAVFLPFWLLVYLVIVYIRKVVVSPRIGQVQFNRMRRMKLVRFNLVLLVINLIAFGAGLIAALSGDRSSIISFELLSLIIFSIMAYVFDYPRLYVYGLLVAGSPLVGEWLYQTFQVSHHGMPITFGRMYV